MSAPAEDRTPSEQDRRERLASIRRGIRHMADVGGVWPRDVEYLLSEVSRLTAEIDRANRALNEIIALDEKGPAWEPYDEFGDPSDIDVSNSGDQRRHGAWTAYQWAARIARAARTHPEGSNG